MIKQTIMAFAFLGMATACNSQKSTASTTSSQSTSQSRSQGQQGGERPQDGDMFTQMDADGDGQLSKSEVKGPLVDQFSTIDTDGNGYISKEEMEKAPKPERGQGGPGGGQGGPRR